MSPASGREKAGDVKKIAILGSTGSIGTQALDVIARHRDRFEIVALAAGTNVPLLREQIAAFAPAVVSVSTSDHAAQLSAALSAPRRSVPTILYGADGLHAVAAASGADLVLAATDGAVSFDAVFAAVDRGIDVAVANKELVVAAGELLFAHARASGARLLPVDSEHSALFQCLVGEPPERVAALVVTASGGPFWNRSREEIARATLGDALRHPTWQMGQKNTIDSASLMNKGLEVIEASRFFDMPAERIHVLVHRTSVAHGFAIFTDGNVKAQLAPPDMRLPIGYALAYPDRLADRAFDDAMASIGGDRIVDVLRLEFERPDLERFPCLRLAFDALKAGGTAPAVLSAANEIAVAAFVRGEIAFGGIPRVVSAALDRVPTGELTLSAVRDADRAARIHAAEAIAAFSVESSVI